MASLEKRNGWFRIVFRVDGQKVSKSLGTKDKHDANICFARVEQRLNKYRLGSLVVPLGQNPADFLLCKKTNAKPKKKIAPKRKSVPIRVAWEIFKESLPENSLEESTLSGMATHIEHLARLIGKRVLLKDIDKPILQTYVDKRSKEKGRYGRNVSVQTIKKELRTFSTVWNWAIEKKLVRHSFPNRKLRYPKFHEKPPFQTWKQIESRIKRGALTEYQTKELWDALFLSVDEIQEVLAHAKSNSRSPAFYPMLCFAAYTGARRSEILRSQIDDLDFESSVITIREKKRIRGKWSTRRVPMQNALRAILNSWLTDSHPGTNFTFASFRVGMEGPTEITNDQASHHFEKTFEKSKWDKLHGWHIFRH